MEGVKMNMQINSRYQLKDNRKSTKRVPARFREDEFDDMMENWDGFRGVLQNKWSKLNSQKLNNINGRGVN